MTCNFDKQMGNSNVNINKGFSDSFRDTLYLGEGLPKGDYVLNF